MQLRYCSLVMASNSVGLVQMAFGSLLIIEELSQDQVQIPLLKKVSQEAFKDSSSKDLLHKALEGPNHVYKGSDHVANNFLRHKDIREVPFTLATFVIASSLSTIAAFASSSEGSWLEELLIAAFSSTKSEFERIQDNKSSQAFMGILVEAFIIKEQVLSACNQAALGFHY